VTERPPGRALGTSIGDYAVIGDTRTAALCSSHGSLDWLCLPRFDSDPVFGRLVGGDGAGTFTVTVDGLRDLSRRYRTGSAVLETTWRTDTGERCSPRAWCST
jgi:GH15 family glucan-1,4-alpha-glucosidase